MVHLTEWVTASSWNKLYTKECKLWYKVNNYSAYTNKYTNKLPFSKRKVKVFTQRMADTGEVTRFDMVLHK